MNNYKISPLSSGKKLIKKLLQQPMIWRDINQFIDKKTLEYSVRTTKHFKGLVVAFGPKGRSGRMWRFLTNCPALLDQGGATEWRVHSH